MRLGAQLKSLIMTEDEFKEEFDRIFRSDKSAEARRANDITRQLIRLTIEFRDEWKRNCNEIVTVADAKKATIAYVAAIRTGKIPSGLSDKIENLVRLWLREINGRRY